MVLLDFFQWWYGKGWSGVLVSTRKRLAYLAEMFSVSILLRTLFSPWRRIITYPGAGLDAHMRALADNLFSRVVGFVVRIFALLAAAVAFIFLLLFGIAEAVVWPLLPAGSVVLIIWGLA